MQKYNTNTMEISEVKLYENGWHADVDYGERLITHDTQEIRRFNKIPLTMVRNASLTKLQLLKLRIDYGENFPIGLEVKVILECDNGSRILLHQLIQRNDIYDTRGFPAQGTLTGEMGAHNIIRDIRAEFSYPSRFPFDISDKQIFITYITLGKLNYGTTLFDDGEMPT